MAPNKSTAQKAYRYDPNRFQMFSRNFTFWDGTKLSDENPQLGCGASDSQNSNQEDIDVTPPLVTDNNHSSSSVSAQGKKHLGFFGLLRGIIVQLFTSITSLIGLSTRIILSKPVLIFGFGSALILLYTPFEDIQEYLRFDFGTMNRPYRYMSNERLLRLEERVLALEDIFNRQQNMLINYDGMDSPPPQKSSYPSVVSDVIMEWTSPTYSKQNTMRSLFRNWFMHRNSSLSHPSIVVQPRRTKSSPFWCFAGNHGNIGIKLSKPTIISHVSITSEFSKSHGVRSFSLWAEVEQNLKISEKYDIPAGNGASGDFPAAPPFSEFAFLGAFESASNDSKNPQVYPIGKDVREMGLKLDKVLVHVTDNWGSLEKTCLMRIWVHGIL